jgi:hypothetical protein
MSAENKLNRTFKTVVETIKDSATRNIVNSAVTGRLSVTKEQLSELVSLVSTSIESTFQRCGREIDGAVKELKESFEKTSKK